MSIFEDFNQENRKYLKIIYQNMEITSFQCLIVKIKETKVKFDKYIKDNLNQPNDF